MSKQGTRPGKPIAQRFVTWASVCLLVFTASTAQAAAFLYAVGELDQSIRMIEPATGVEINTKALTVSGVTPVNRFDSVLGAAINPPTGVMYALIDLKDRDTNIVTRKFVSINPRSGTATDISSTDPDIDGDMQIGGLAFTSNGTLYAVTSDNADVPSTLYTVDLGTGAFTFVMTLGNGLAGETIAFNPDDGKLYHASGMGVNAADKVFEAIDLNTLTLTNIPLSGATAPGLQMTALVYDAAQGEFVGFRNGGGAATGEYFSVTTAGVETFISAMTSEKGLAFLDTDLLPPVVDPGPLESHVYAVDRDGPYLSQLDSSTGEEIDLIGITLPGNILTGGSGLAMDPLTGDLYATLVVLGERSNHRLVKLDPLTGVATLIGLTGHIMSGLAFDSAGTLYSVSADDNATFPSWLFSVNTTTAFASLLFDFGTANTPDDGETIAFNSNDGLLYHASGGITPLMETIDVPTFTRTTVILSGNFLIQATALGYNPLNNRFMGAMADGRVFSMTPGGFVAYLTPARLIPLKGFGVITPLPPTANPNGPYIGTAGIPLTFDSTGSTDPDGSIVSYAWDFGDTTPGGAGPAPSHTYVADGLYTVSLTVTDDVGLTDTATTTASIDPATGDIIFGDGFEDNP